MNAILSIADKLRMQVIAEGVETREQLGFLRALGCEAAQGYLIHRPSNAAEVLPTLLHGIPLAASDSPLAQLPPGA